MGSTIGTKWLVIQTAFTLSGACALAYEIVWGRWLATVLGGSAMATSIVLAAYMGGLALGSYAFGRLSERTSKPLLVYVAVELLIGLTAATFPSVTEGILGLPGLPRTLIAFVVLLLPTFFMGGTVPLVMAWSREVDLPQGRTLGRLYGLNTLGAAAGCLLAGFWLIPQLGLSVTNATAATINVLIGLGIYLMERPHRAAEAPDKSTPSVPSKEESEGREEVLPLPASPTQPIAGWMLYAVAVCSGWATLGLEVIWIRLLRITLGSTTYTFTLVIATFILGIGLGGLWAGRIADDVSVRGVLARSQVALFALLLLQFAVLPTTPLLFEVLRQGTDPWLASLLGSALLCLVVLLPVTLVVGFLFPLLGRLYMERG
ncbi:MAG: fused MFS/spermidine synthase, partial [Myxococcota bacterium]